MSNDVTGIVVSVELGTNIPYANKAGSYPGAVLKYESEDGYQRSKTFSDISLEKYPDALAGLKSLSVGDKFSMKTVRQDRFVNVTAIDNLGKAATAPKTAARNTFDPSDNPARRGQILNLAVQVAIAHNKIDDDAFILGQCARMAALTDAVQDGRYPGGKNDPANAAKATDEVVVEEVTLDDEPF